MPDEISRLKGAFVTLVRELERTGVISEFIADDMLRQLDPPQASAPVMPAPAPASRYPYEMDTTFTFGKYSGYTVTEVLRDNPSYIVWAAENVERFKVNPVILADARTRTEDRARYRAPAPTNYQPNFGRFSSADLDDDVPF